MGEFNIERFRTPANSDKPVYTWEWSGRLSKESIKRQLQDMKRRDIHTFYILPIPPTFRPENTYSELNVAYLGKEYMDFIRYTAECAKELDMSMWLYDEPGWPSGNAGSMVVDRDETTAIKWVEKREIILEAKKIYKPRENVIVAFCREKRIEEGFLSEEDETILEFYWDSRRRFTRADILEPNTVKQFLECTYEAYKKVVGDFFGNLIPCIFTDEPSVLRYPWPYDFAGEFMEKYGYDIRDYMPLFIGTEINSEKGMEANLHYHELISELLAERFFGTVQKWCSENNIKFVGHIDNEHDVRGLKSYKYGYLLRVFRHFDIPGIDVIWRQIYPAKIPCKDGYGFFPRLASSAAAQNGKEDAISESFGVYGSGMPFDTMRYVINYQMIRGINIFNFMTLGNREHGFTKAIWGKELPQGEYLKQLHDYMARLSFLLTLGERQIDTALYMPIRDIFAGGKYEEKATADFIAKGYALEKMGIDFDLVDDTVIEEAEKRDNTLYIGLAKYKNVILPECSFMPEHIKAKLEGMSNSAERSLIMDSDFLRTKTRLLADGKKIILIFNESIETVEAKINFPEMKYLYELDLVNGDVISCEYDEPVSFYCGEIKAFLLSDEPVPSRKPYIEIKKTVIDNFVAAPVSALRIDAEKVWKESLEPVYQEIELGAWDVIYGKDFSGEVSYKTELTADEEECRVYCIDLGRVDFSARIRINGREYGLCTLTPKKLFIPYDEMPKGKVSLEIIVANTGANQYVFGDYDKYYTKFDMGPYDARTRVLEADVTGGGLYGPITLSLLKINDV